MFNNMKPIYARSARAVLGFFYLISLLISCKDSQFLIFLILRLMNLTDWMSKVCGFYIFPSFRTDITV